MSEPVARLYLATPALTEAESFLPALQEALAGDGVACVLLRLAEAKAPQAAELTKKIVAPTQARGVALVIDGGEELVETTGADGAHVAGAGADLTAAIKRLGPKYIVGAGRLATRHEAMLAGEAGADYVLFDAGNSEAPPDMQKALLERVAWWSEVFTTPCVARAQSLDQIRPLLGAGADFLMLDDCVWRDPRGPRAAMEDALRLTAEG